MLSSPMLSLPLRLAGTTEREAERPQERATLLVVGCGGADGDVHAAHRVDLVVVDFREDQLLGDAERVVAATVERVGVHAPEVADAGDGDADEPVVELPHPVAPARDLGSDRGALPQFEARDRLPRP